MSRYRPSEDALGEDIADLREERELFLRRIADLEGHVVKLMERESEQRRRAASITKKEIWENSAMNRAEAIDFHAWLMTRLAP